VFLEEKILTLTAVNSDTIIDRKNKKYMVTSSIKMLEITQRTIQKQTYRKYSENDRLLEAFVPIHLQTGTSTVVRAVQ
jgi:hypothetical protein